MEARPTSSCSFSARWRIKHLLPGKTLWMEHLTEAEARAGSDAFTPQWCGCSSPCSLLSWRCWMWSNTIWQLQSSVTNCLGGDYPQFQEHFFQSGERQRRPLSSPQSLCFMHGANLILEYQNLNHYVPLSIPSCDLTSSTRKKIILTVLPSVSSHRGRSQRARHKPEKLYRAFTDCFGISSKSFLATTAPWRTMVGSIFRLFHTEFVPLLLRPKGFHSASI